MLQTRLGACQALLGRGLRQFWTPLGRLLAGFWLLLGGFWTLLGASWPPLGRFRAPLGSSQAPFGCVRRSGPRFWRVWEHAGLGFRRLGRHVLACRSLRLAFHDIMLFVTSAWPWPVSCQQDLPKWFSIAKITFWKATALLVSRGASLPLGVFAWPVIQLPNTFRIIITRCDSSWGQEDEHHQETKDQEKNP